MCVVRLACLSYLPFLHDGSSVLALLQSCMEYGSRLSRSKVGLDFRPLISPLFCRVILDHWKSGLDRACGLELEQSMHNFAWRMDASTLKKLGISLLQQQVGPNRDALQGFLGPLLPHPPLAILADAMVAALNSLAKCAPLDLAPLIAKAMQKALESVVQRIKNTQTTTATSAATTGATAAAAEGSKNPNSTTGAPTTTASAAALGSSSADLVELARAFRDFFIPFANALILRVYPHATGQTLHSSTAMSFTPDRGASDSCCFSVFVLCFFFLSIFRPPGCRCTAIFIGGSVRGRGA